MLFFHPMWSHESQRIGKQRCTPIGYTLHVVAELIGFLGLLLLLAVLLILLREWLPGGFRASQLWGLAAPFGLGIVSEVLFHFSWWLAIRKGFRYDDEHAEASWIEAGERRTFKFSSRPPAAGTGGRGS